MGVSSAGESYTWQVAHQCRCLCPGVLLLPYPRNSVALHLNRREHCRRRKMILEMGRAKFALRDRDRGRRGLETVRGDGPAGEQLVQVGFLSDQLRPQG